MNIFLQLKNKKLETNFYGNLDGYTAHLTITHMALAVSALPITLLNEYYISNGKIETRLTHGMEWVAFYIVLLLLAILTRRFRAKIEKHQKVTRWVMDLFYTGLSGYLIIMIWDAQQQNAPTAVQYLAGWWHCLTCIATFGIISRWYLKTTAFFVVILRMTVGSYVESGNLTFITAMAEILVFVSLNSYFQERSQKKHFIEKYKLHVETLIFKEILSQTTEGIIICELNRAVQFRNLSYGKFSWWDEDQTFIENLEQIQVEQQINLLEQAPDAVLNIGSDPSEPLSFAYVIERLAKGLKPMSPTFLEQSNHQMQNLMIVNGRITNRITNANQMLEIRVMWLMYQEVPSLALIFTDITERNLVIKLQDTNDYKNRLLASVSHELRTPLNASINFIQAAIEDPQTPTHIREEFLAPSLTSNQLLLHLINDILDFSQMAANKLRLIYGTYDVKKTFRECVNLMKLQANKKGLELSLDVKIETQNSEFTTDHNRLKQIILNLLSNAVKFTLNGTIKVKAKLSDTMNHGKVLYVDVTDTGIGISDEDKKKLFKSFEKIELGERAFLNSTGVGLGLVISSNLVLMLGPKEKNNGIQIKSQVNEGTTFSFWIVNKELIQKSASVLDLSYRSEDYDNQMDEIMKGKEIQVLDTQANLITSRPLSTRRNLILSITAPINDNRLGFRTSQGCLCPPCLIVDDDVFNITAFSTILKQLGQTCDTTYNGRQAIEKVLERQTKKCGPGCRQYNVIFMDYSMPIMDGFEATRELRDLIHSGKLPMIHIIGCTAFVQEKELKRGIEAGMDGYCIKPINRNKVRAILSKLND